MKKGFVLVLVLAVIFFGCLKKGAVSKPEAAVPASAWHALLIGQNLNISSASFVVRVPGGWVFHSKTGYGEAACFIPYSSEGK